MRSRTRRLTASAALVVAGGSLLALINPTCGQFAAETIGTTMDFCFIFDCQSGILGGVVNPCDVGFQDNPNVVSGLAFQDCPDLDQNPGQFPVGP